MFFQLELNFLSSEYSILDLKSEEFHFFTPENTRFSVLTSLMLSVDFKP